MSEPETPRAQSYEEIALRGELDDIIRAHYKQGDFAIDQDDDFYAPAEVIFAGVVKRKRVGGFIGVKVCDCILDGDERVIMVSIGDNDEYQIADEGIISTEDTEFHLDVKGLMMLRFWIRETKWSKDFTEALLQNWEHQT